MYYTIECCGPSREFFSQSDIVIETEALLNSEKIKALLLAQVRQEADLTEAQALLEASIFATEKAIVPTDSLLPQESKLYLLPPVCGG